MEICKYSWARKRWHQCPELNITTTFLHCSVCQLMQWQFCCYRAEAFIRDYQYWEEIIIRLCIYVSLSSKGFYFNRKKTPSTLFSLDICVWSVKAWPRQYRRAALVKAVPVQLEPSLLPMPGKAEEVYWGFYWVLCSVQGVLEGEMQNKIYYYRKILTWVEFAKSVCHPSEQNRGAQR